MTMENKKKITVDELSVLLWLKVLDDYEVPDEFGNKVTALKDKIERFDITTADIEPEFFYDTVNKLEDLGLMTEDSLSDKGVKVAAVILENPKFENALLEFESAKITAEVSIKEICQFIKENRNDIYNILSITIAFLELVS